LRRHIEGIHTQFLQDRQNHLHNWLEADHNKMIGSLHEVFLLGYGHFLLSEGRNILCFFLEFDILGHIRNRTYPLVHEEDSQEGRMPFGFFDGHALSQAISCQNGT